MYRIPPAFLLSCCLERIAIQRYHEAADTFLADPRPHCATLARHPHNQANSNLSLLDVEYTQRRTAPWLFHLNSIEARREEAIQLLKPQCQTSNRPRPPCHERGAARLRSEAGERNEEQADAFSVEQRRQRRAASRATEKCWSHDKRLYNKCSPIVHADPDSCVQGNF